MKTALLATAAALGIQPVVAVVFAASPLLASGEPVDVQGLLVLSALVLAVAAVHFACLGVPALLLLKRYGRLNVVSVALAGAAVGSVVVAALSWPAGDNDNHTYAASWYERLTTMVELGQVTPEGWASYLRGVSYFALHGLAGGLAFFAVWRKLSDRADP